MEKSIVWTVELADQGALRDDAGKRYVKYCKFVTKQFDRVMALEMKAGTLKNPATYNESTLGMDF